MKLDESLTTDGIVSLNSKLLSAKFEISKDKFIKVSITTSELFPQYMFSQYSIGTMYGTIKEGNKLVTMYNCEIASTSLNSHGLYQYVIISNIIVFEANELDYNLFSTSNLSISLKGLNKWVYNNLVKVNRDLDTKIVNIAANTKEVIEYKSSMFPDLESISSYLQMPYGYNQDKAFEIDQVTYLKFKFAIPITFDQIFELITSIGNLFSYIFQTVTYVDEVSYQKEVVSNGHKLNEVRHIWYSKKRPEYKEYEIDKIIFDFYKVKEDFPLIIKKWANLSNNIKYLNNYFTNLFETKYIDQKLLSGINMIEAIHRFAFGDSIIPVDEHYKWVESVVSCINEEDKDRVKNILIDKNGFSLKTKFHNIIVDIREEENTALIREIISFRGKYSHGAITKDLEFDRILQMYEYVSRIINKYIFKYIAEEIVKKKYVMLIIQKLKNLTTASTL